jgi:hypothetical protein
VVADHVIVAVDAEVIIADGALIDVSISVWLGWRSGESYFEAASVHERSIVSGVHNLIRFGDSAVRGGEPD